MGALNLPGKISWPVPSKKSPGWWLCVSQRLKCMLYISAQYMQECYNAIPVAKIQTAQKGDLVVHHDILLVVRPVCVQALEREVGRTLNCDTFNNTVSYFLHREKRTNNVLMKSFQSALGVGAVDRQCHWHFLYPCVSLLFPLILIKIYLVDNNKDLDTLFSLALKQVINTILGVLGRRAAEILKVKVSLKRASGRMGLITNSGD